MHTDPKIQAMPSETISPMKTRSLISLLCLLLCSCSSWLPPLEERTESRHFNTSKPVLLDNILQIRHTPHNNGLSDIYLLDDPHEAFAARAALIESAEHSLDLQYYIWRNDISGRLLFNLMYLAAERGVRVRLLLDDNNTRGLDDLLLALDSHPNIEVRLFNPFVLRKWRALGYLTDFPRLNRRMHNKSFTADNRATILGGRNIGDEYFKVGEDTVFADLDILATPAASSAKYRTTSTATGQAIPPTTPRASSAAATSARVFKHSDTTTKHPDTRSCATAKPSNSRPSTKKYRRDASTGRASKPA